MAAPNKTPHCPICTQPTVEVKNKDADYWLCANCNYGWDKRLFDVPPITPGYGRK